MVKSSAFEFYLPLIKKEQVAKGTYAFFFDRARLGADFNFSPGQYIHLYLPIKNENGRGNSRMFTISSSPLEKNHIMVVTRIIKSLFKKALLNLVPGTKVKFYGPSGGFVLHQKEKRPQVFLAGGIGITAFLSMLSYIDQKKLNLKATLIVSFSRAEDFIYKEKLERIEKRNPNIKIIYIIGRISKKIIKKYVPDIKKSLYYIVGPPKMVEGIYKIVETVSIKSKNILTEDFEGY